MIASPCSKVCAMDAEQRYCLGCWRTLAEIASWGSMTDEDQQAVLAQLQERRAASLRRAVISPGAPPRIGE